MPQSPIYWHPVFYNRAMRLAYGSKFETRYKHLERYIPENCELLELCMGDAFFYQHYLQKKNITYKCADINPVFVRSARKKGIDAQLLDVYSDPIPKADYILMQASLYHFIPDEKKIIEKLLDACNKAVIISENVENLSNASSKIRADLGTYLSKAKSGQSRIKFTRKTLRESLSDHKHYIDAWEELPENKEVIIVLRKYPVS
jgi:hypothetical protein